MASADEGAEFELSLAKPLGIAFEERLAGRRFGVVVGKLLQEGSAPERGCSPMAGYC